MRYLILLLFALRICAADSSIIGSATLGSAVIGGAAAGGGECPADGSPSLEQDGSTVGAYAIGDYDFRQKCGQKGWTDSVNHTFCKVAFKITRNGGDVSAINYRAEIWTLNGDNLSSMVASSATQLGDNGWGGWIVFPLLSDYSYIADTPIAVLISSSPLNSAGSLIFFVNEAGSLPGSHAIWNGSDNTFTDGNTSDIGVRFYWKNES